MSRLYRRGLRLFQPDSQRIVRFAVVMADRDEDRPPVGCSRRGRIGSGGIRLLAGAEVWGLSPDCGAREAPAGPSASPTVWRFFPRRPACFPPAALPTCPTL